MSDTHEPINQPGRLTPGQMLRQSRRARGLSEEQVAKSLRLSQQYIIDLENDDYRHVSALVYLRGHFRSYAKLLEIEEDKLLGAFEATGVKVGKDGLDRPLSGRTIPVYAEVRTHKKRVMLWLSVGTILLIGVILLIAWIARTPVDATNTVQNETSVSQPQIPVAVVNTPNNVAPATPMAASITPTTTAPAAVAPHQEIARNALNHNSLLPHHVEKAATTINASSEGPQTITPDYKVISNSGAE